jgi:tetratricopeptide (TPR) repeat protein
MLPVLRKLGDLMRRAIRVAFATLLILLALHPAASGQSRRDSKLAWLDCRGRDIATIIRGCTTVLERKGAKRASITEAHLLRGKALAKRGKIREAIADFNEVIDYQPRNAAAHLERGYTYWLSGDKKRARADMDAAIRLKPDATALGLRGWFLKDEGDADQANADFDRAIVAANNAMCFKYRCGEKEARPFFNSGSEVKLLLSSLPGSRFFSR